MSMPDNVPAMIADQRVATATLAPYVTGLVTLVMLIGLFFGLFIEFVKKGDWKASPRRVKVVASIVLAFIIFCLGLAYEEIVDTAVSQKRSSAELFLGPAQSNILPILTGVTSMICQTFLMARAAVLIPSQRLRYVFLFGTTALILLALAGAALFSACGYLSFFDRAMPMNYFVAEAIWLWSSAAADVLISIALSISLHKRIRGFNPTLDGVLKHLILVGLRTAAYSAAASIIGAALATAFANSSDYHVTTIGFAWWVLLPGLHAISLFTTLSTRRTFANALGMNGGVVSPIVHDIELSHDLRRGSAFHSTTQVRPEDDGGKSMSQTSSAGGGGGGRGGRRPPIRLSSRWSRNARSRTMSGPTRTRISSRAKAEVGGRSTEVLEITRAHMPSSRASDRSSIDTVVVRV